MANSLGLMIWLGAQFAIGVVLALVALGLCVGAICAIVTFAKAHREERKLADRWKENADPFMGAP